MDQERIVDMLYTKMQLETAQMYAGVKEPVLSNDARGFRNNLEQECQRAENEAANARELVEQRLNDIENFESYITEEEFCEAKELLAKKEILLEKINTTKQTMNTFDTTKAKQIMEKNTLLRERLAYLQAQL